MRKEGIRRIVIRGPNWLGDAVMCEPALSQARTLFPHCGSAGATSGGEPDAGV